jgi:hypothetical protein
MSSADTFAEKAPLLKDVGLAKIVLFDLLAPEVREHVESVYVYGSFVDPDRELDRDGDVSDLDVYVTVGDEVPPTVDGSQEPAEVSTRFGATEHGLLCRCATQGALEVFGRGEAFDVPLPDAPEPVVGSVERAERAVFHAREIDGELLRFRPLDLTLGTPDAFATFVDGDPHLEVWPLDEDGADELSDGGRRGGPGAIYECQACGEHTLRDDECPACGCENLELVTRGP